jgi:hypothetical protein
MQNNRDERVEGKGRQREETKVKSEPTTRDEMR